MEIQRMSGALFRLLGQRIRFDGERLSRLAEALATDLHTAGFRLPARRQNTEAIASKIYDDLLPAARALPEFRTVPLVKLRERMAVMSLVIAARGYRKVVTALLCAAGLFLLELQPISPWQVVLANRAAPAP
jgi:hypothetical protein